MVEDYDIDLDGEIALFGAAAELNDTVIDRKWQDSLSARLGGTFNANEWLGISLGAYWERGVMPKNYTHLDLISLDRLGLGGGVEITVGRLELAVGYLHTFQPDVTVSEERGKVFQQRPIAPCPDLCDGLSGVPANAGTFKSSYDMVSVAVGGQL